MRAVKARGLDKVFKNRDRRHRVRRQILRKNEGLILGQFFSGSKLKILIFRALEAIKSPKRSSDQIFTLTNAST